jgi:hypothetical protein
MDMVTVHGIPTRIEGYKLVPVGKAGKLWAVVDDEDYGRVVARYWSPVMTAAGEIYAQTNTYDGTVGMHRFVMGCVDPKLVVDHRDGHGLHNRRYNLREATYKQNAKNKGASTRSRSGIPGVDWIERWRMWEVSIRVDGVSITKGSYKCLKAAARVREAAELEHYGEFARSNAVCYVEMIEMHEARMASLTNR